MDLGIAGKWALVCGASKGLGRGCALALVREGVHVVIVARGREALERTTAELTAQGGPSVRVLAVAEDITTVAGRAAVFAVPGGPGVNFDIVVTNAGGPPPGDFRDWDRDAWIKAIDANMLTPIELIKATVDGMAERGFGRIVNITSKGVTINNLLPGKFDTDRIATTLRAAAEKTGKSVDDIRRAQQAQIPAGRYGTAEEFGAICAFLCSQQAAYLTGQNILPDGGAYPGTY